jgi:hypothetical protein
VHFEIKEGCWGRIPWRRALGQRRVRGGDRWRWSREGERERERASVGKKERRGRRKGTAMTETIFKEGRQAC